MNRIALAAAALLTFAAPASAQFRGDYYDDRGYGGGWYDGRGPSGRRGYDPYDDDDRPRRYRRGEPAPYARPYGGPPSQGRGAGGQMCVTSHGSCRQGVPVPIGTPCGCVAGGVTARGFIR